MRKPPSSRKKRRLKAALIALYGSMCVKCRFDFKGSALTLDHIKPHSMGGRLAIENLQLMCKPCNLAKADLDALDLRPFHPHSVTWPVERKTICKTLKAELDAEREAERKRGAA